MPKIKRNEYLKENVYEDDYVSQPYEHLIEFLHKEFGLPRHMIEYHPCAGDESLFVRFRGESFWLFELDEEQFYTPKEWKEYVQIRLNDAYTRMEKLLDK